MASSAPRPSTTQTTPSRPSRRAVCRDPLAVLLRVDALDLPDVRLDAGVLELDDRAPHQLGAQLGVVAVGVAADLLELASSAGHEQLEEELAVVLVEPVGEALEALRLALVHLRVAIGVVADEHLREVGVEALDVVAEVVAVLEVELVLAGLLDRHRELEALSPSRPAGCPPPNCSSTRAPVTLGVGALLGGLARPSKIRCFASAIFSVCSVIGVALDTEHLLLELASLVRPPNSSAAVSISEVSPGAAPQAAAHQYADGHVDEAACGRIPACTKITGTPSARAASASRPPVVSATRPAPATPAASKQASVSSVSPSSGADDEAVGAAPSSARSRVRS